MAANDGGSRPTDQTALNDGGHRAPSHRSSARELQSAPARHHLEAQTVWLATDADLVSLNSAVEGVSPLLNRLELFVDQQPDASLFVGFIVFCIFCVDGFAFPSAVWTRLGSAVVVCSKGGPERRVGLPALELCAADDCGLVDPVAGDCLGEHVEGGLVFLGDDVGVVGVSASGHGRVDTAVVAGRVDEE